MALMLPSEIEWVLDLLGYDWPDANEDKIHEAAEAWRQFGQAVRQAQGTGGNAAQAVFGANSGDAVESFGEAWKKFSDGGDGYLEDAAQACEILAFALDAVAMVVLGSKVAVIAQLIALAIEIAAAQAAAPFTLGISEVGAAGATQATRLIVRRLLDELKKLVIKTIEDAVEQASVKAIKEMVIEVLKEAAVEAGKTAAQSVVQQGVQTHFGAQDGIDFGQAADAGLKKGVNTAVDGIKDGLQEKADGITGLADPNTYVDAAKDRAGEVAGDHAQSAVNSLRGGSNDEAAGGESGGNTGETGGAPSTEEAAPPAPVAPPARPESGSGPSPEEARARATFG